MSYRFLSQKIKGGTLYMVLCISLIMAFITSFLLLLRYYYKVHEVQVEARLHLEHTLDSSIEYVKASTGQIPEDQNVVIDLFADNEDSVTIRTKMWGLYQVASVSGREGNIVATKTVLLGSAGNESQQAALHLKENSVRGLSVLQNTVMKGLAFIPGGKIIPGWIDAKYFNGDISNLEIKQSPAQRFMINEKRCDEILSLLKGEFDDDDSLISFTDSLTRGHHSTSIILSTEDFSADLFLKGNIIFYSALPLVITRQMRLEGVIVLSPEIVIEDSVKGVFQAFASKRISVGKGVTLSYPSCLAMVTEEQEGSIEIDAASIEGAVVLYSNASHRNLQLVLKKNSEVVGEVFVDGVVQHYGKVIGHISCEKFLFNDNGQIRENALCNAVIDRLSLPEPFAFTLLSQDAIPSEIVEWL